MMDDALCDYITYYSVYIQSSVEAEHYLKTHDSTHRHLAYRDIPKLIQRHIRGPQALDFGTGAGYSAQFLKDLGFDVVGVDISPDMLAQARYQYPEIRFQGISGGKAPFTDKSFDFVFSSFVLFELDKVEMTDYLSEARRLLKNDGLFVAITGSEELHSTSRDWLIFDSQFPQNEVLKSGDLATVYHYESGMEFTDYFWTIDDYRKAFKQAKFDVIEVAYPLGKPDEPFEWRDELTHAPFAVIVAKPI